MPSQQPPSYEEHERIRRSLLRHEHLPDFIEYLEIVLDLELDTGLRHQLEGEFISSLYMVGRIDDAIAYAQDVTDERPDDALAWRRLASRYHLGSRPDFSSPADRGRAIFYLKKGVAAGRRSNKWLRLVMHDLCRALRANEDYAALEQSMIELMEDLKTPRDVDIPFLEADWLRNLPDGALSEETLTRYHKLMQAEQGRREAAGDNDYVPTLEDLSQYSDVPLD